MLEHGGRLREAARRFKRPVEQWLDLSTGISPFAWPVPALPQSIWQRLPETDDNLSGVACDYYGAPAALPVAGSQAAIQALPLLRANSRVGVLEPTYAEHTEAWRRAEKDDGMSLRTADPDPRCFNSPRALATSQHPWATVLTCSDSRVSPSWVFDTTPGELFVIRNAGNTAFTEAIASVEYSVSVLKTPLLMVMGHSGCGAVTAAMDTNPLTPSLDRLIQPIRENINGSSDLEDAVKRNALASASTLIQRSAVLAEAKASGALKLVVGCFQLSSGVVSLIE